MEQRSIMLENIKAWSDLKKYKFKCIRCPFPEKMEHEPDSSIYHYLRGSSCGWDTIRKHLKEYHPKEFKELWKRLRIKYQEADKVKHIKIKPKKIVRVGRTDIDVTKHHSTQSVSNQLYVKHYKNGWPGVSIKMRSQGEIIMPDYLAGDLALLLRKYSNLKLYTSVQVAWIMEKFKHNKDVVDFVGRIMGDKVTLEEIDEIRNNNKAKEKIADRLSK